MTHSRNAETVHDMRRLGGRLLALLLFSSAFRPAVAADPATVRVIRDGTSIYFDGTPPASDEFRLDLEGQSPGTWAMLDVWPQAVQSCDKDSPSSGRQVHHLAMILDSTTLRATVPPLQVGQVFCFQMKVYKALTNDEATAVAQYAAGTVVGWLNTPVDKRYPDCIGSAFEERLRADLTQLITLRGFKGDLDRAVAQAAIAFEASGGPHACAALHEAQAIRDEVESNVKTFERRLEEKRRALRDLPAPPPLRSPLVTVAGQGGTTLLTPVSDLMDKPDDAAVLEDAQAQLVRRAAAQPEASEPLKRWIDALQRVKDAKTGRRALARKLRDALLRDPAARPREIELRRGDEIVSLGKYVSEPNLMQEENAAAQLADLEKRFAPKDVKLLIEEWRKAFLQAAKARVAQSDATKTFSNATADVNAAVAKVHQKLQDALSSSDVRQALRSESQFVATRQAGKAKTPDPVNYASVDLGALVAWPGGGLGTWLVTYAGVNLYLVPVERRIAVGDLVGPTVRQRMSLTVGWAISGPTSSKRSLSGPMGGKYPLVGVGLRMGQFTRVLGGAFFYEASSPNPASREKPLYVAGFVGASLDFDVVKFLSKQMN